MQKVKGRERGELNIKIKNFRKSRIEDIGIRIEEPGYKGG